MSQIQQVVKSIQHEFRFNDKGQAFVSIRGAARLAGVHPSSLSRAFLDVAQNPSQMAQFLMGQGIEGVALESFVQSGIPDTALSLILEYFAYECRQDYRTQEAKACYRAFGAIGIRTWLQSSLGYEKESSAPYYYRRLQLFQERTGRIPSGYFCIFMEITHLISDLERCGHMIADDAIIDISVGKLFCKYLREQCGIEPGHYCLTYPHYYPGRNKPVNANLYPVEWLTTFRKWFDFTYCTHHLERYFKGRKDAPAILAVQKFLGLLPAG